MNRDRLRAAVLEEIGEIAPDVDLAGIGDDSDLREALDIDSISFLNFMIALDKRLGIAIPEIDYPKLATLKGALAYLTVRLP